MVSPFIAWSGSGAREYSHQFSMDFPVSAVDDLYLGIYQFSTAVGHCYSKTQSCNLTSTLLQKQLVYADISISMRCLTFTFIDQTTWEKRFDNFDAIRIISDGIAYLPTGIVDLRLNI